MSNLGESCKSSIDTPPSSAPSSSTYALYAMEFLPAAYRAVHNVADTRVSSPPPQGRSPDHRAFERMHASGQWHLDLAREKAMGLVAADWSTSASDIGGGRQKQIAHGRPLFDARWATSPMGRSRADGRTIFDPRGVVRGMDAEAWAIEMKEETAAAKDSAELYKIENNQGLKNLDHA